MSFPIYFLVASWTSWIRLVLCRLRITLSTRPRKACSRVSTTCSVPTWTPSTPSSILRDSDSLLAVAVRNLDAKEIVDQQGNKLTYRLEDVTVSRPRITRGTAAFWSPSPACWVSWAWNFVSRSTMATIAYQINGVSNSRNAGLWGTFPSWWKSSRCNLTATASGPAGSVLRPRRPWRAWRLFHCQRNWTSRASPHCHPS